MVPTTINAPGVSAWGSANSNEELLTLDVVRVITSEFEDDMPIRRDEGGAAGSLSSEPVDEFRLRGHYLVWEFIKNFPRKG